jgi:hypothetical protein
LDHNSARILKTFSVDKGLIQRRKFKGEIVKNKIILLASLLACLKAGAVTLGPPTIPIPEIPEPSATSLAAVGCGLLCLILRKRKGKS